MAPHRRKGERGIGLLAVALWIGALAVIAAVAVDVARLSHTASEVQSIADAAALAGAKALLEAGGVAGPEQTAAFAVANQNRFNGQLFPLSNDATANLFVEPGTFDPAATPPFSPVAGGGNGNAVRATPTGKNIPFIAAALVGPFLNQASSTGSDVTKSAIAAFGCGTNCQPDLPIAICNDVVTTIPSNRICESSDFAGVAPLSQTPAVGVSCFTSLGTTLSASSSAERDDLPRICGGLGAPSVAIGQAMNVQNGQVASVLSALRDCVKPTALGGQNQHIFTLPVIETCGGCTGDQKVTDFIALRIGCDDPTCTRDSCPCPGALNTWDTAVVDTGSSKGIFNAVEVCDNKPCGSVDFSKTTCGPYRGTVLVN
jgi:putative Flp pilus-assembly TadE/G-like protein